MIPYPTNDSEGHGYAVEYHISAPPFDVDRQTIVRLKEKTTTKNMIG